MAFAPHFSCAMDVSTWEFVGNDSFEDNDAVQTLGNRPREPQG